MTPSPLRLTVVVYHGAPYIVTSTSRGLLKLERVERTERGQLHRTVYNVPVGEVRRLGVSR